MLTERALAEAREVDHKIARGADPGTLAGVPFAVKNLFDVRGIPTLAGSVIRAAAPPPERDAAAITSLNQAGAVLVGALNMDEFAYGFTTENSHYGATRNPHDLTRVAGGSSGGSAAAVAAGMVPLTLGLGHERLHSGARVVLRNLRPEADLRPPLAPRRLSLRQQPRPRRAVRAIGRRILRRFTT